MANITKSDAEFLLNKAKQYQGRKKAIAQIAETAIPQPDGTYRIEATVTAETLELLKAS